jgi:hypothetical protein
LDLVLRVFDHFLPSIGGCAVFFFQETAMSITTVQIGSLAKFKKKQKETNEKQCSLGKAVQAHPDPIATTPSTYNV